MSNKVTVILDGQYGSCGKGAYAQFLARLERPALLVRNGGPNAGHSVRTPKGVFALRHIPAGVVELSRAYLVLPPAALIHLPVLLDEIAQLEAAGFMVRNRLRIDPLTTVITHEDELIEKGELPFLGGLSEDLKAKLGSTREGVGAAQAKKVMRRAKVARDVPELQPFLADTWALVNEVLDVGGDAHLEMTQGHGLSLHFGHYPYTTSRDITPAQALNDAGISPSLPGLRLETHLVARTYPIRVAGNSGPMNGEIDWATLHRRTNGYVHEERTTVTKLVRRVSEWDAELMQRSVRNTRPTKGVLTFVDYLLPELGASLEAVWAAGEGREMALSQARAQTDALWKGGFFDLYRQPYQDYGSDIHWLALGFGIFIPTPAHDTDHI